MEEWKEYKLGALIKLSSGGTPDKKNDSYWGGQIPWISAKSMYDDYLYTSDLTITDEGLENGSRLAPVNSILLLTRGSGLFNRIPVCLVKKEMAFNQDVKCLESKGQNVVSNLFLFYWLMGNKHEISAILETTGIGAGKIDTERFKKIKINLPPIDTQKVLVEFAESLMLKIEVNRRINDNFVVKLLVRLFIIWVFYTLINDNFEQQAQALFDKLFPKITKGDSTIGNMITPQRGKGLLSKNAISGDVPVVAGGIEPATYHNIGNTTPPVLSIAASGANAGYVNLWHKPVWSSDSSYIDASMTDNVYFWYVMLKKRQKEIFDAQVGSAQPHIYPKHIAELPMHEVKEDELSSYSKIVTPLFKQIGKNMAENDCLASIRDALLPKLMSGELKINELSL